MYEFIVGVLVVVAMVVGLDCLWIFFGTISEVDPQHPVDAIRDQAAWFRWIFWGFFDAEVRKRGPRR